MNNPPRFTRIAALAGFLAIASIPTAACAQIAVIPPQSADSGENVPRDFGGPGYADLTDLVIAAPVIVDATIRSAAKLKPAEAPGLAPGLTRFYIEADAAALLRGPGGMASRIGYLLDVMPDRTGKLPQFKKRRVLLFARVAPTAPDQLQLVAPDAQLDWTPDLDARVRGIAQATIAPDAPPRITGVGNAFHVPGSLPGEGETQIFLATANGAPVSLSILRRPGEQPRWAVALSEIVDEAAGPPQRDTLLWYRLACGLPRQLPERSTTALGPDDAEMARQDYGFVLGELGPCGRTRDIGGAVGGAAPGDPVS